MWMTAYIKEIQRQFIQVLGFPENPEKPGIPMNVPDGEYPMTIEGKLDKIRIINGGINCSNFKAEKVTT